MPNLHRHFCGTPTKPGRWGFHIHLKTFYRVLKQNNLTLRKLTKAPHLTPKHHPLRLDFARTQLQRLKNRLLHHLERTIFSDGTVLTKNNDMCYDAGEVKIVQDKTDPRPVFFSVNPTSKAFMAYAGVTLGLKTDLLILHDYNPEKAAAPNTDAILFFIREYLVPLASSMRQRLGLGPQETIWLVWDHAAVHRARAALQELALHHIEIAGLPPRTPELNIIETLWYMLKRKLRGIGLADNSYESFLNNVVLAWNELDQTSVDNVVRSYEGRCKQMVDAQGMKFKVRSSDEEEEEDEDD